MADQTRRPEVIAFSQRLIVATDVVFTLGGVVLILIGGFGMVWVAGLDIASTPWLQHGLVLFGISGLIWVLILIPIEYWQIAHGQ